METEESECDIRSTVCWLVMLSLRAVKRWLCFVFLFHHLLYLLHWFDDLKTNTVVFPLQMSSQKVHSTPPPAAVQPLSSNAAPPRSPASPSPRSSSFRFTGQAQAHFSPSVLSPPPSPPCVSPSLSRRLSSPRRPGSPQRSVSAMSGYSEVHSLEELFPVQPPSEELHSDMSVVSSEGERSCDLSKCHFWYHFVYNRGFIVL